MNEKIVVVQGAVCKCAFGSAPDRLKVHSHRKEYANDSKGAQKLIGTTLEIGATFENNSFGNCLKMGSPPPPCKVMVSEWQFYFKEIILSNGGYILVEDSKAVCAVAGTPCIEVVHHGQMGEPGMQNFVNADSGVNKVVSPLVDIRDTLKQERKHDGIIIK